MKKYISIEMEFVEFETLDIIRTSNSSGSDNENETEILPFKAITGF